MATISGLAVDLAVGSSPCGPDPERWVEAVGACLDAGFDEVDVQQIGPDLGFFRFWETELRPGLDG